MADGVALGDSDAPRRRIRSDWPRRLLNELLALFIALLVLLAAGLVLLDTAPGHRFIIDRLARFETASGLKIRIGRIDGSVFGKSQLRNVSVADNRGTFLTSPESDGRAWTALPNVPKLSQGGNLGYDPAHKVLYSSNLAAGLWRVVVP